MPEAPDTHTASLDPLPYQREVIAFLKGSEPELWKWASSPQAQDSHAEKFRTELLKANYRLDAEGHAELVARCAAVAERLSICTPVTLYQGPGSAPANAMLCFIPGEAHLVFFGPILSQLQGAELDALIAHELAHFLLWERDGGDFLVADRLLSTAAADPRAAVSHVQTARRFRLFTEIFADRGAVVGCGQLEPAVAALVKTETGLPEVSAASYLRQAEEIFAAEEPNTTGISHPETFIRARALRLWSENHPDIDDWLSRVIEGPLAIGQLDILGQSRLTQLTKRFLADFLRPKWFQTPAILAHARAFFPNLKPESTADETLADLIKPGADHATREYWIYLLLDFAAADPELDDLPLAHAFEWSKRLGIADDFEAVALKELRLRKREWNKLKKNAEQMLAEASARP